MGKSVLIESILISIKKLLGIEDCYDHFDPELVMFINSGLETLDELGVGTPNFRITGPSETWDQFLTDSSKQLESVKEYLWVRTRLIFDPPQNSFITNSFDDRKKELEWRMLVQAEGGRYA